MTDQDNLRDRIADILEALDGMDLDRQAQSIIDDLGLTVEAPSGFGITMKRVVGRWQKQ